MSGSSPEWGTYRRLIGYAMAYRAKLVLGIVFGLVFAFSMNGLLISARWFFLHVFNPIKYSFSATVWTALVLVALAAMRGMGIFLSMVYIEWVGNRVVMDLRTRTFDRLMALPVRYFNVNKSGELISRITNDSMLVERAVSTVIGDLIRQPFVLAGTLIILFWLELRLAAITFICFPLCLIPVTLFGRLVRKNARESQRILAELVSVLQEAVTGIRIVKAFGMENYEKARFSDRACNVFQRVMRMVTARAANDPIIIGLSTFGLCMILFYARWTQMPAADFMAFVMAFVMMYDPIKKLSRLHLHIQQSSGAADRIFEVLDAHNSVRESDGAVALNETIKRIAFENVTFCYEDAPVLHNINLQVNSGECIALVGHSGSGKTSLVSLLPRFFDVSEGSIKINDRDIRAYTLRSLRGSMGLVSQETVLFNDTVTANIAYGHSEASLDQIREAAQRAYAHEFIQRLPQGYETVIGERGQRLSGGERQRLSIARAILRNPPILILDEATSSLDAESERQVQAALDALMENRTVFAIAHRLSTIAHADRIIVLEKGAIVEQGQHHELMELNGVYRYHYDLQFAK